MNTDKRSLYMNLSEKPGIYVFKNGHGSVIYIGKAKVLKKRVQSYFSKSSNDWKVNALVNEIASVETIQTTSEHEALLLEAQLISKYKPKYNVLLKSGQPFLYILFTQDEIPRMVLVRNKKIKGTYFGPFLQKSHARGAYNYLLRTFALEWCNSKVEQGCLRYHLGLCVGSCRPSFDLEGYRFRLQLAQQLLKGKFNESLTDIKERIAYCNKHLLFEQSKNLTRYLHDLETIFNTLKTKFSATRYDEEIALVTTPVVAPKEPNYELADEFQQLLKTEHPIRSIDCFDVSHFQSSYLVGSCIRFVDGLPDKNNFRRFKIKTLSQQNDYAALQEIVSRRYAHDPLPDLIIIDGGKGQLSAAKMVLPPSATVISLAKREERLFIDTASEGIVLDIHSPIGKLCIALRDYAHHFAISYHRLVRKKSLKETL